MKYNAHQEKEGKNENVQKTNGPGVDAATRSGQPYMKNTKVSAPGVSGTAVSRTKGGHVKSDSRKIIFQLSIELLVRVDNSAQQIRVNRSSFIRTAIEEKVGRCERERLEADLREGYTANADYYESVFWLRAST